ncbi:MAG TPA: glycosyltransferase family A protein [Candidatus Margulisiibacteriota bacterium]|nr:glycosyltransferase family A protein [Candidatus Margulisiibacteriota bacterium]
MARLSVIIPVHNGAAMLQRCVTALQHSDLEDYECIVVDDGSTDDTAAIAATLPVTLVTLERCGGPARARNHGAARARGDILVFIDSDVCVHRETVRLLAAHLECNPATAAVFGSYDDTPADPHFVSQYKNLLHHYVHQRSSRDAWTFWAGCGAIRRDLFLRMGGFDESYVRPAVEDIDLGLRLRAQGERVDLAPEIQVTHLKRWTVTGLIRTDVFSRAIPWLLLMLRYRVVRRDLNVTAQDRASVALTWIMMVTAAALACGAVSPRLAAALFAACAAGLCLANFDFYRFLARKRGVSFVLRALPLHWLYSWYCGLAVPMALCVYAWRPATARQPFVAGRRRLKRGQAG